MTATLKSKQTSIAMVWYPILTVACFLTLLLFHYPLPLKFQKSANMTKNTFLCKIWRWVSKQRRILCWFRNCWEKCEKFDNKKVTAKKSVKNQRFSSSILLTCKTVWQITFCGWIFFRLFPQIWNQREILRILNTHKSQKNTKNFGVIESYMSIC